MKQSFRKRETLMSVRLALGGVFALLVLVGGCYSAQGGPDGRPVQSGRTAFIGGDELLEVREIAVTAFDAVRRLRPAWLRGRGPLSVEMQSQTSVRVYVDGMLRGTAGELKDIPTPNVLSIRFLSAPEATTRFGLDHVNGAIMVTMRR